METNQKIFSVLLIGGLTYLGYDYFKNKAGTNQNPVDKTYDTMGSSGVGQYTTNYNFSDLFGSGQGTAQTKVVTPQEMVTTAPSNGSNTGNSSPYYNPNNLVSFKSGGKNYVGTPVVVGGSVTGYDTGTQSIKVQQQKIDTKSQPINIFSSLTGIGNTFGVIGSAFGGFK